jgi:hypothetical protein
MSSRHVRLASVAAWRPWLAAWQMGVPQACDSAGLSVEFARSGKTKTAAENESVLVAATAPGIDIRSACQQRPRHLQDPSARRVRVEMTCEHGLDVVGQRRRLCFDSVLTMQREADCTNCNRCRPYSGSLPPCQNMNVSSSAIITTGGPPDEIFTACASVSWPP